MEGFAPAPEGQVTLANWRAAPFNRWAFHHVREIVPSADIPSDPRNIRKLPRHPVEIPLGNFFEETDTDGLVVLHRGRIVLERYASGMAPDTPHILMSVSKSMLGLLAGTLAERGVLDLGRQVSDVIPELKGTAYKGAAVRQLLDMRVGIAFDEDYLATSGAMVAYRKATGWSPVEPGDTPSDLRSFYRNLTDADGQHGGRFHYVSPNTDLLGWVIERASGARYADLMSELLWKPMGASTSAYITVDRLGAPRCAGGMCATVEDLARVGQLILEEGRGIIPRGWIDDILREGDAEAWNKGTFAEYFPGVPMHYRSKWYVRRGERPLLFGLGIHGQNLYIDRAREVVIAKLSSQALPMDAGRIALTGKTVSKIRKFLAPT